MPYGTFPFTYRFTKGKVYELQFVLLLNSENYHSRVGVTFPDGTLVSPLNSRIFLCEYFFVKFSVIFVTRSYWPGLEIKYIYVM